MLFPQPTEPFVDEVIEAVDGECPECGEATVCNYRLVDYRGWMRVTKCRSCLHVISHERTAAPAQGG
jgi:hypothetical protein